MEKRELTRDPAVADALALLSYYRFEFGERPPDRSISEWLENYPANWVRLAIVEALYQGRYKAISVTQILVAWQRRDQPYPHFNYEFESLVCRHVQMPTKETKETIASHPDPLSSASIDPESAPLDARVESEARSPDSEIVVEENAECPSVPIDGTLGGVSPSQKGQTSIVQFSPSVDRSDFYTRLKTIAQKSKSEDDRPEEGKAEDARE